MSNPDEQYGYIWFNHFEDRTVARPEPEKVWDADRHGMSWKLAVHSEQYPLRQRPKMGTLVLKGGEDGILQCKIED